MFSWREKRRLGLLVGICGFISFASMWITSRKARLKLEDRSLAVAKWVAGAVGEDTHRLDVKCQAFIKSSPGYASQSSNITIAPEKDEILDPASRLSSEPSGPKPAPEAWYAPVDALSKPPDTIFFISEYHIFPPPGFWDAFCTLEAAAIFNPDHRLVIYSPRPQQLHTALDQHFGRGTALRSRLHAKTLDEAEILASTPFQKWYEDGGFRESEWVEQNLGNAVRLAILWKEGGTYFDLDMIAVNPLGKATRALAREDWQFPINNAGLTFPPHDPFVFAAMKEFVGNFDGNRWGWQGPYLVTRTLVQNCPRLAVHGNVTSPVGPSSEETVDDPEVCNHLTLYRPARYYAIGLHDSARLFALDWRTAEACDLMSLIHKEAIGLHVWHSKLKDAIWTPDTLYYRILQRSCPQTTYIGEGLE